MMGGGMKHALPPDSVALDAGDTINLVIDGRSREFHLTRITDSWSRAMEPQRSEGAVYAPPLPGNTVPEFEPPQVYGAAILELLDIPMQRDSGIGFAPYAAASATPFAGVTVTDSVTGSDFALDTVLPVRATFGETVFDFWSGPTAYFDVVNTLRVKLYSGALASLDEATILSGRANARAIRNAECDWEILQFCNAALIDAGIYDLNKLLRGRLGTEHAMRNPVAAGARIVIFDGAIAQIQAALAERGVTRFYKWGPSHLDPSDVAWQQAHVHRALRRIDAMVAGACGGSPQRRGRSSDHMASPHALRRRLGRRRDLGCGSRRSRSVCRMLECRHAIS